MRHGIEAARARGPDYLLLPTPTSRTRRTSWQRSSRAPRRSGYELVSLMVKLHCRTVWERLLIPAFVFFFFKLYPSRHVADPARRIAAAAGGVHAVRRTRSSGSAG